MNYNSGKYIIIATVIIFIFIVSFFLFKMFTLRDEAMVLIDKDLEQGKEADISDEINLDLLESNKFINLKGDRSGSSTFEAGRRNPFEPYENQSDSKQ